MTARIMVSAARPAAGTPAGLVSGRLPPGGRPPRRSGAQRLRDNLAGYAFISPWLVGFLLLKRVKEERSAA